MRSAGVRVSRWRHRRSLVLWGLLRLTRVELRRRLRARTKLHLLLVVVQLLLHGHLTGGCLLVLVLIRLWIRRRRGRHLRLVGGTILRGQLRTHLRARHHRTAHRALHRLWWRRRHHGSHRLTGLHVLLMRILIVRLIMLRRILRGTWTVLRHLTPLRVRRPLVVWRRVRLRWRSHWTQSWAVVRAAGHGLARQRTHRLAKVAVHRLIHRVHRVLHRPVVLRVLVWIVRHSVINLKGCS